MMCNRIAIMRSISLHTITFFVTLSFNSHYFCHSFTTQHHKLHHHSVLKSPLTKLYAELNSNPSNHPIATVSSDNGSDRRRFLSTVASTASLSLLSLTKTPIAAANDESPKILVLGGTGFVGSRICNTLSRRNIPYTATSRDGRDGTLAFDVTTSNDDVSSVIEKLASDGKYTAVISTIGSIGTPNDGRINAASGLAAVGAKRAGVKRFVYIGVAPEVRDSTGGFGFLGDYMSGKESSREFIQRQFGSGDDSSSFTIINPTFIYGGDSFGLNPPRVSSGYGKLVEGLLSTGLFRFAAGVTPGLISVALEPPVSVEDVAGAAVAGGLGVVRGSLDTHDDIVAAAKMKM